MTRREQLREQYEDALFALMMDEVATAEGEKALEENERLNNDPDAAVPAEVTEKSLRMIRQQFTVRKARTVGRFTAKALSRVALVAGITAILFTVAFASSETVRANTLNLVVEVFGEYTSFSFAGDAVPEDSGCQVTAQWLPEGYVLEEKNEDRFDSDYLYRKSENEYLYVLCTVGSATVVNVDTEDAETKSMPINGMQAMIIEKGERLHIVWSDFDRTAFVQLIGVGISENDLIHVAEQLTY